MSQSRWYPTQDQLKDPASTERAFRQLLSQHYLLQDQVNAMKTAPATAALPAAPPKPNTAPGVGSADSYVCGLPVEPIPENLADGTKLTYVKATGTLKFK